MLISHHVFFPLFLCSRVKKVALHVGAHRGEEISFYERFSFDRVDWVEGQAELCVQLKHELPVESNTVYEAYAWSETGVEKRFRVTNNSQSSSLLRLGTHAQHYPQIEVTNEIVVRTSRLDDLIGDASYSFVNLDIQGAEFEALKGMGDLIASTEIVYTEVNREALYESGALVGDLDDFLNAIGFERIITKWTSKGWGDAVYVRDVGLIRRRAAKMVFRCVEWSRTTRRKILNYRR